MSYLDEMRKYLSGGFDQIYYGPYVPAMSSAEFIQPRIVIAPRQAGKTTVLNEMREAMNDEMYTRSARDAARSAADSGVISRTVRMEIEKEADKIDRNVTRVVRALRNEVRELQDLREAERVGYNTATEMQNELLDTQGKRIRELEAAALVDVKEILKEANRAWELTDEAKQVPPEKREFPEAHAGGIAVEDPEKPGRYHCICVDCQTDRAEAKLVSNNHTLREDLDAKFPQWREQPPLTWINSWDILQLAHSGGGTTEDVLARAAKYRAWSQEN
jgi:hypothetical protein